MPGHKTTSEVVSEGEKGVSGRHGSFRRAGTFVSPLTLWWRGEEPAAAPSQKTMNKHAAATAVQSDLTEVSRIPSCQFSVCKGTLCSVTCRSAQMCTTLHFRISVRDYCARDCNYANAALLPRARSPPPRSRSISRFIQYYSALLLISRI